MLSETLDKKIVLTKDAIQSPNLCDRFGDDDLKKIGAWVARGYQQDLQSRSKWERRMEAAMDLALQVLKDKNYPWPNCANIAFPLVTIAALQFHARAYPTIISGSDVVKCRVIGSDETGAKTKRADRISTHMSWQVTEQDASWEEQHDKLLIVLPITGSAFVKTRYAAADGFNVSELVLPRDFVINYFAKSVDSAQRKTHVVSLYRNEIYEKVRRETFRNILDESWYRSLPQPSALSTSLTDNSNRRTGQRPPETPDETTPFRMPEQHVNLDLDGDGYAEPYIITFEESSQCVTRIVTRFDSEDDIERNAKKEIISIRGMEYFTKYSFIPSPDGGIYDLGFGVFLGPLNESVNSLVNIMLDSGHLSTGGVTMLGRGAKIRGGNYTFSPFSMMRVDSTGDDLRKSIYQMQFAEPSAVLFQLLSLLINYTQRISGSTDIMVGENIGQNTPKGTADTLVEQGSKIYNATFKRVWRDMKSEFKKLFVLNAMYMPETVSFGQGHEVRREDYLGDPNSVAPAADPNISSEGMQVQVATAVLQRSTQTAGYDKDAVERKWLKAMKVDGAEELFKGTNGQPPPKSEKVQIAEMELSAEAQEADKQRQHEMGQFVAEMQVELMLTQAKVSELQAKAATLVLDVQGDAEDRQVAIVQSQLALAREKAQVEADKISARIKLVLGQMDMLKKKTDVEVAAKKGAISIAVAREKGRQSVENKA